MPVQELTQEELRFREYCCKDSNVCRLAIYEELKELEEFGLRSFYDEIVQPLAKVIVGMNLRGLPTSEKALDEATTSLNKEIEEQQRDLDGLIGRPINVNGDALGEFLEDDLGLKKLERTKKTKKVTLKEDALKKLGGLYPELMPLFDLVLTVRSKKKLVNTFLSREGLGDDWRMYPNFKIGPVTGRLACKKPNFQNYPEGVSRKIFRVGPGFKFVYGDYSQVEIRILAILANDVPLLLAFANGLDIHDTNARDIFGLALDQIVGSRQRYFAKTFLYGLNYGGTIETIRGRGSEVFHDIPIEIMDNAAKRYFDAHPAILEFRKGIEVKLKASRKLVNAFGRPRVFFGPAKDIIRAGYNYKMQAGAADLMNTSLILVDKEFPGSLVLQVHDSLMLEVPESEAEEVAKGLKGILERPVKEFGDYSFPSKVIVGDSWGDFA